MRQRTDPIWVLRCHIMTLLSRPDIPLRMLWLSAQISWLKLRMALNR